MIKNIARILLMLILAASCSTSGDPQPQIPDDSTDVPPPQPDGAFYEYKVLPHETYDSIQQSAEPHYAYVDTRLALKGKLVVFIGGTRSYPVHFQSFSKTAASLGYHVVNVNYPNMVSVRVCSDKTEIECFTGFHEELLFGGTQSPYVSINKPNSIANRTVRLLQYLHKHYPLQGWNNFYQDNDLLYTKFIVAGHSQGGGHAAYLAYKVMLHRAIVFASPNDYSEKYMKPATWCTSTFATPADRLYGLNHHRDEIVPPSQQYAIWKTMGMLAAADTISANHPSYKNFRALYTNIEPNPDTKDFRLKHNAMIMDPALPPGTSGKHLQEVWMHLLGN